MFQGRKRDLFYMSYDLTFSLPHNNARAYMGVRFTLGLLHLNLQWILFFIDILCTV